MQLGPESIEQIQRYVIENFATIKIQDGEVGSCKKMVPLNLPSAIPLCVVFSQRTDAQDEEMIHKERKYLEHIASRGYPAVKVFGLEFLVENNLGRKRYAMLLQYHPGVFIEAKTPALLKILIAASLLNIPTKPREAWLMIERDNLIKTIQNKLINPQNGHIETEMLFSFKAKALQLYENFLKLKQLFEVNEEIVNDLQMILSPDGELTIIDPLDVISLNSKQSPIDPDLSDFLKQTKRWLTHACEFCQLIANITHPNELGLGEGSQPLIFRSLGDPRGKSRLNQLKAMDDSQAQLRAKKTAATRLKNSF